MAMPNMRKVKDSYESGQSAVGSAEWLPSCRHTHKEVAPSTSIHRDETPVAWVIVKIHQWSLGSL